MAQSYPVFQYILYNGSSMFFGLILNIRNIIFNTLDIVSFAVKMSYHSNLTGIHIFIVHLAFYRVRNRFFLSLCFRLFQCDNLSHIFILKSQHLIWVKAKHIFITDSVCDTVSVKFISEHCGCCVLFLLVFILNWRSCKTKENCFWERSLYCD